MRVVLEETQRCPGRGMPSVAPCSARQRPWQGGEVKSSASLKSFEHRMSLKNKHEGIQ